MRDVSTSQLWLFTTFLFTTMGDLDPSEFRFVPASIANTPIDFTFRKHCQKRFSWGGQTTWRMTLSQRRSQTSQNSLTRKKLDTSIHVCYISEFGLQQVFSIWVTLTKYVWEDEEVMWERWGWSASMIQKLLRPWSFDFKIAGSTSLRCCSVL